MIEVTHLTKQYGNYTAISDISFTVQKGEILGLIGPNGSGKSTTMNMLAGTLRPTSGMIKINDIDILKHASMAKKSIGYLSEIIPFDLDLTVKEYLFLIAKLRKIRISSLALHINTIIIRIQLEAVANSPIKNLSKGYRRRVGIAQALVGDPELLILDEPTASLDLRHALEIRSLIKELSQTHTIILSSHLLSEVSKICDKVLLLNKGTTIASDTPENLIQSFSQHPLVTIRVKHTDADFMNYLSTLPGVLRTTVIGSIEKDTYDIVVELSQGSDIRESIFNLCYEMYNPLLMMNFTDISLEYIFLQLTSAIENDKHINVDFEAIIAHQI